MNFEADAIYEAKPEGPKGRRAIISIIRLKKCDLFLSDGRFPGPLVGDYLGSVSIKTEGVSALGSSSLISSVGLRRLNIFPTKS